MTDKESWFKLGIGQPASPPARQPASPPARQPASPPARQPALSRPGPNWANQTIWTGDNLNIMRGMNSGSVDLIYLDPPFNSSANYAAPIGSEAAGAAFKDTWGLDDINLAWHGEIKYEHPGLYDLLNATRRIHSDSMMAYLIYMAIRMMEMHRLLKSTGSLYLHCDPTASHYLKLLLDSIFDKNYFLNEIIWHYGKMSNTSISFPRNHDVILRYSKSDKPVFHVVRGGESEYKERYKSFLTGNQVLYGSVKHKKDKLIHGRAKRVRKELGRDLIDSDILFDFDNEFKVQSDVIYIPIIKGNAKERTGYPTQKPLALLRRIIEASSNLGDVILDPFCGCATACIAAEELQRQWIGIDISPKAADLVQSRMRDELKLFFRGAHRNDIPERTDLGQFTRYNHPENKKWLYGEQGGYCNACETHFEIQHFHIDHIVSKSTGGSDHISNLQLLCGSCNAIKGPRPQEYLLACLTDKGWIKRKKTA